MGDEEERAYFYRLYSLIVEYGTEILIKKCQRLLSTDCPPAHSFTFKEYLKVKEEIITGLRRRNTLTKTQFDQLQQADPKLEECDITLLTTLLQNIFSTQLKAPKKGWDVMPDSSDATDGANVIRLRMMRNKYISHKTKTSLTKKDFKKQWSNVTDILKNLATPFDGNEELVFNERIDTLLKRDLDIRAIEKAIDETPKLEDSNMQVLFNKINNTGENVTVIKEDVTKISANVNILMQEIEKKKREDMNTDELQEQLKQKDKIIADLQKRIESQEKQEHKQKPSTEIKHTKDNTETEQTSAKKKQAEGKSITDGTDTETKEGIFAVGDIVQIVNSLDAVEQFQEGHGGFNDLMEKCVGQIGKVIKIDKDGDLRIRFGISSGSRSWTFNPLCCGKVEVTSDDTSQLLGFKTHDFTVGDVVKIIDSAEDMEKLQDKHGGFNQKMRKSLGQLGRIIKIDDDGDLYIKTEKRKWLLNPECCIKVTDESVIAKAPVVDSDDDNGINSLDDLLELRGKLRIFKDLFEKESSIKTIPIDNGSNLSVGDEVKIIEDLETVKQLQDGHGGWVDDMKASLGKIGIVKRFMKGGDGYLVYVKFGARKWAFNPLCCSKLDKIQSEPSECQPCMGQSTGLTHMDKFNKRMDDILGNLAVHSFSKEIEIFRELNNMKKGDTQTLKEKLDKNPLLVNAKYDDVSVLQLACYLRRIEAIRCLMEKNVDLQAKFEDGNTALHSATYGQSSRVMALLLEKGLNPDEKNKEGFTSLHIAVQNGSVTCSKVLLDHHASVNIQDNHGNTPMHACTAHICPKTELINTVFSVANADFSIQNSKGLNVLQYLSEKNCYRAAEIVCERRPDIVNAQHKKYLYTALHICAKTNHHIVAGVLLKYDGDPNIVNERKCTPLHLAVQEGHQSFVELLVQNGCQLNLENNDGNTALHLAQTLKPEQKDKAYKITQILINRKANIEIRNKDGKLPVEMCNDMTTKELFTRDFSSIWDPMVDSRPTLVTLSEDKHNDEYHDVCRQFLGTLTKAKIFNIKRVQNRSHLEMYKTAKAQMKDNSAQNINERNLFHGTTPTLVDSICTKRTDPRHSGCLDHPLGEGAYYVSKAKCANKYTRANDDQHRFMILCSVLAGRWTLGQPSYVTPPPIDPADPDSDCYDSCVDDIKDPTMFCLFHQDHFYPQYIIKYADIEESSNDE